jgi:hypothetical protein
MSKSIDSWSGEDAKTTLHLVAGLLFGPEFAAAGDFTSDYLISAVDCAMEVYLCVTAGENYLLP